MEKTMHYFYSNEQESLVIEDQLNSGEPYKPTYVTIDNVTHKFSESSQDINGSNWPDVVYLGKLTTKI